MATHVLAQHTADCPCAAAMEYALEFFAEREQKRRIAEIHLPLRAFGLPLAGELKHQVQFTFSLRAENEGNTSEEIAFAWKAGTSWLPDFHGTLGVRMAPNAGTTLSIEGDYTPPFGSFGRFFDRILGHKLAQETLRSLLDQIAERLEMEQQAFKAATL